MSILGRDFDGDGLDDLLLTSEGDRVVVASQFLIDSEARLKSVVDALTNPETNSDTSPSDEQPPMNHDGHQMDAEPPMNHEGR